MTPIITCVQTLTYDFTPSPLRLSPVFWNAFAVLNKIHSVWRWYRRAELYANPNNLAQLLAGHAVNFIVGDLLLVRIAAQCLLISTRVLECVRQQTVLHQSGQLWIAAVKGYYPKPVPHSWKSHSQWKRAAESLWNRIERIAYCTFIMMRHAFELSMRVMDAIDAFCLSPYTRNEGINEGFVNAMKWLNAIVENKEELLEGLADNREVIERILQNSPLTYPQLYNGVSQTLEKTEIAYEKAQKVSKFSNGILIDLGKRMIGGAMVVIGLAPYRPMVLAEQS